VTQINDSEKEESQFSNVSKKFLDKEKAIAKLVQDLQGISNAM
jgi:hypothetical protein